MGSSTGGFTDCLLQRGAARVWAVDAGHGQLDWKLRNDPRVVVREGVNARYLKPSDFPESFDLAVCDASFISSTLLIPAIVPLLEKRGEMVILVKPQFEVGRGRSAREASCAIRNCTGPPATACALSWKRLVFHFLLESPILGAEGNREFLLYARPL